jgi:nucleotidyltransferase substrate binding protein (TIGR01987 family)
MVGKELFVGNINCSNLVQAFAKFEDFSKNLASDLHKTAAIKAFEYTYEIAWKIMKRILKQEGIDPPFMKDLFRESLKKGLISDSESWFKFMEKRNISAHTYNETSMDEIIEVFEEFKWHVKFFLKKLENISHAES